MTVEELASALHLMDPDAVVAWEASGEIRVTQVQHLARVTRTPLGLLYLAEPPTDDLPIRDFRTVAGARVGHPGPELLDTIHQMQRRQEWMRGELLADGAEPLQFVGSVTLEASAVAVAAAMQAVIDPVRAWVADSTSRDDAFRRLRQAVEDAGVLVVVNGVVGNNTRRKLDVDEFRGFALVDPYAPLVFVNSADHQAAQLFTLVHECARIWLGESGVSGFDDRLHSGNQVERWCNAVAGAFLVPADALRAAWLTPAVPGVEALARTFRVSALVLARRALDLRLLSEAEYTVFAARASRAQTGDRARRRTGGNFWLNQNGRIGQRFGRAVINATLEGRLLYSEVYRLTDLRPDAFDRLVSEWSAS